VFLKYPPGRAAPESVLPKRGFYKAPPPLGDRDPLRPLQILAGVRSFSEGEKTFILGGISSFSKEEKGPPKKLRLPGIFLRNNLLRGFFYGCKGTFERRLSGRPKFKGVVL